MTTKITTIGLQELLNGKQIEINGTREIIGIELDRDALQIVNTNGVNELFNYHSYAKSNIDSLT